MHIHGKYSSPNLILKPTLYATHARCLLAGGAGELRAWEELHLLPVADVGEWRRWFLGTVFANPLFDIVVELDSTASSGEHVVRSWPETMHICNVYHMIQERSAPKLLVDKTPGNAAHPAFLRRARKGWQHASMVHLYRHPVAVIPSAVDLHGKVLLVQGVSTHGAVTSQEDQFAVAEKVWADYNRNILDVLEDDRISLSFERLVVAPLITLQSLCQAIGVSFCEAMLDPYDASRKMGDKAFAGGGRSKVVVGDHKIFKRVSIEASQADKWQSITLPSSLSVSSRAVAGLLGYDELLPMHLPKELVSANADGTKQPDVLTC